MTFWQSTYLLVVFWISSYPVSFTCYPILIRKSTTNFYEVCSDFTFPISPVPKQNKLNKKHGSEKSKFDSSTERYFGLGKHGLQISLKPDEPLGVWQKKEFRKRSQNLNIFAKFHLVNWKDNSHFWHSHKTNSDSCYKMLFATWGPEYLSLPPQ